MAAGGGVAFFLGERCDVKFFNDVLYRDGKGLFPVPLARQAELLVDRLEPAPDVQVEPHFIFRVFAGKRNTFLQTVAVRAVFRRAGGLAAAARLDGPRGWPGCATARRWWSNAVSARAAWWRS